MVSGAAFVVTRRPSLGHLYDRVLQSLRPWCPPSLTRAWGARAELEYYRGKCGSLPSTAEELAPVHKEYAAAAGLAEDAVDIGLVL